MLFLFLLYVGYLLLRSAVADPATRARYAAVLRHLRHGPGALYSLKRLPVSYAAPDAIILKPSASIDAR